MKTSLNKYDVILEPAVTEKGTYLSVNNQVVFYINTKATKADVKNAVKEIFSVDVVAVNTINLKGKSKRFKGRVGRRSDVKKAVVTIKEGQAIDLTSEVK